MKMSKNYKRLCAVLGLSLVCGTGMVSATSGSKLVSATYRDIKVVYNGATQTLRDENGNTVEPFAINGTTYLPLRAISNVLGVGVTWEGSSSSVILSGNTSSSTSTADVSAYITKINSLQAQLSAANAELATYKNAATTPSNGTTPITTASLNDTANYLYSNYSDALDSRIDLDFELTQKASRLQLNISYSTSSANSEFDSLSESKVKSFIKSVCEDIVSRHGDVAIQGDITYSRSDNSKVSFSVTSSGAYTFDFDINEDKLTEAIEDSTNNYLLLGSLGKKNITTIDASIRNDRIDFALYLDCSSATLKTTEQTTNWNNICEQIKPSLRSQLKDIVYAIEDESNGNYSISGVVYTSDCNVLAEIDDSGTVDVSLLR